MVLDGNLCRKMQANQAAVIQRILQTSTSPRGALLAYLAAEGLKFLELLDFHRFDEAERSRIIAEIDWLAEADPAEAARSS